MKNESYMVLCFFIDQLLARGLINEKEANETKQKLIIIEDSTMQPITLAA